MTGRALLPAPTGPQSLTQLQDVLTWGLCKEYVVDMFYSVQSSQQQQREGSTASSFAVTVHFHSNGRPSWGSTMSHTHIYIYLKKNTQSETNYLRRTASTCRCLSTHFRVTLITEQPVQINAAFTCTMKEKRARTRWCNTWEQRGGGCSGEVGAWVGVWYSAQ